MHPRILLVLILCSLANYVTAQSYGWASNIDLPGPGRDDAICFTLDEKVIIGTGSSGVQFDTEFYAFNTRIGMFEEIADFPGVTRQYATVEEIGFKAYIIGGIDQFLNPLNDVWEYDIAEDVWTEKASFPGGERWKAASFMVDQKIYYGTGRDWNQSFNDLWEYDPELDSWRQKSDFPALPRDETIGFAIFERGYVGLGIDCTGVLSDEIYQYDPFKDEWTFETNFPGGPRWYATAEILNGRAFVGTGEDSNGTMHNDFWAYDPTTHQWEKEENVPLPARRGVAACTIPFKGIYFACGLSDTYSKMTTISRYTDRNFDAPDLSVYFQYDDQKVYIYDLPSVTFVRLVSLTGKLMFETNERVDHVMVDVSDWAQGVYVVWVGQQAKKFMVYH